MGGSHLKMNFRIVKQYGLAKPFVLNEFNNFDECLKSLYNYIDIQKDCFDYKYYVLNNFYKNEYSYLEPIVKFSIEELKNNEWVLFQNENNENIDYNNNSKIYNINININLAIKNK